MQDFRVVYCAISHESLEYSRSRYIQEALDECVYHETASVKWDIPWCTMRDQSIA